MSQLFQKFFSWYKRNYKINLYITAFLFLWQLVHLYWMTTDVVLYRIFGKMFWNVGSFGSFLISVVDYTEIPALILTSVFYFHELKEKFSWKSLIFLILLNSQWIHLFWITDEIVFEQFTGSAFLILPIWISWSAIFIDYLELPVMYDTIKKAIISLRKSN